jgi:hypothetical protein
MGFGWASVREVAQRLAGATMVDSWTTLTTRRRVQCV